MLRFSIAIFLILGINSLVLSSPDKASTPDLKEESMSMTSLPPKGYAIRRGKERGFFDHDWLKTYHTFSFADYYDPKFMGFRSLRVLNEDRVSPGKGFPTHRHSDMEIITVLLEGELAHKDSMTNERVIREHEIQAMSAGTGVAHSEYNPSTHHISHFLQIWITPDKKGIAPRYQQRSLSRKENEWILLASKTGAEGSLLVQQDIMLYMLTLTPGHDVKRVLGTNRYGWIQLMEGEVNFNGEKLYAGDGVVLNQGAIMQLSSTTPAKLLFFDLN